MATFEEVFEKFSALVGAEGGGSMRLERGVGNHTGEAWSCWLNRVSEWVWEEPTAELMLLSATALLSPGSREVLLAKARSFAAQLEADAAAAKLAVAELEKVAEVGDGG